MNARKQVVGVCSNGVEQRGQGGVNARLGPCVNSITPTHTALGAPAIVAQPQHTCGDWHDGVSSIQRGEQGSTSKQKRGAELAPRPRGRAMRQRTSLVRSYQPFSPRMMTGTVLSMILR